MSVKSLAALTQRLSLCISLGFLIVVLCASVAGAENDIEAAQRVDKYNSHGSHCYATDCCSKKRQTLAADCFVFIPFLCAALSYGLAYAVAQFSQQSGCSSYTTVNATSVSIVLSTTTGSITATSIVPSVVSVTTTLTIVEAAYQVSTTTQTVTFTTTPLVISVSTSVSFVTQNFTYVTCNGPKGKKKVLEYVDHLPLEPLRAQTEHATSYYLSEDHKELTVLDSSLEEYGQRIYE